MINYDPILSVIIPTYNDATYLERLLAGLVKQRGLEFEVIVSDANSKDKVKQVVEVFSAKLDIHLVNSEPKGPAHGRNLGAKKAKGQWLLFLDADDEIDDPIFLKVLRMQTSAKKWATASARIHTGHGNLIEKIGMGLNYQYLKLLAKTKHPVAPGFCILTKHDIFDQFHGFNEKIQFGEDYDYVSRVGKHGFGFITSTYYYVDFRRAREEGWRLTYKAIANEIYRHTHHYNLENANFDYQFGKHKKIK